MYKTKIFSNYCVEDKLAEFLNENKIDRKDIVSITMSSDSEAHRRLANVSVDRILLVWWEEPKPKIEKSKEITHPCSEHSFEVQIIGKELLETIEKWVEDYDKAQTALKELE